MPVRPTRPGGESGGAPTGPAGGELDGTYPNPVLDSDAVVAHVEGAGPLNVSILGSAPRTFSIQSATSDVVVGMSAEPTTGQILTALSGSEAEWADPSSPPSILNQAANDAAIIAINANTIADGALIWNQATGILYRYNSSLASSAYPTLQPSAGIVPPYYRGCWVPAYSTMGFAGFWGFSSGESIAYQLAGYDTESKLSAGAIPATHSGSAGCAGSYTLAAPTFIGQELYLYALQDFGGSFSVGLSHAIDAYGNTQIDVDAQGFVVLRSYQYSPTAKRWRIISGYLCTVGGSKEYVLGQRDWEQTADTTVPTFGVAQGPFVRNAIVYGNWNVLATATDGASILLQVEDSPGAGTFTTVQLISQYAVSGAVQISGTFSVPIPQGCEFKFVNGAQSGTSETISIYSIMKM